jgi:CRP-like cAMP-binding protein
MRRLSKWLQVELDHLVFARGDMPRSMYFVVSGEVKLIRPSQAGGEIVLQRARRGFLAEASLDQRAYHCDAIAAAASEMIAIPRKAFCEALDDRRFRTQWIGHLARELRTARAHSERLSLRTARERIIHFIEIEGEDGAVTLTETKKEWAASLGLTHEALYRALSKMQKDGQLYVDSATVRLAP